MTIEKFFMPEPCPLPLESEVPCSECGGVTFEYTVTDKDALGWIISHHKVRACYACGKVEAV